MRMGLLHIGQPLSMDATVSAHVAQKRECPHGTRATPARGWSRQTSHLSDVSDEASAGAAFPVSASVSAALSSRSDSSPLSSCTCVCSGSACMTQWLTARRNCIRVYSPLSYLSQERSRRASLFCWRFFRGRQIGNPRSARRLSVIVCGGSMSLCCFCVILLWNHHLTGASPDEHFVLASPSLFISAVGLRECYMNVCTASNISLHLKKLGYPIFGACASYPTLQPPITIACTHLH